MSETDHPHFNLVDEPWILARDASGRIGEYSLSEIFAQAKDLEVLSNETPQQDFAILRVLLAILQRSISDDVDNYIDDDLLPADVWGRMWKARALPLDKIRSYLKAWHHRFDLFDDEAPFMQVARWKTAYNNSRKKISDSRLMLTSGNKRLLTPMRTGEHVNTLTFAEAARWLITAQAYAPIGGRFSALVKPRKTDNKTQENKQHLGWCGEMKEGIYARGMSLLETLLLNFVLCSENPIDPEEWFDDKDDLPAWEQKPTKIQHIIEIRVPEGRADLFTWQSRQIRLFPQGQKFPKYFFSLTTGSIARMLSK